ncbi:hypothetical protein LTR53_009591 [Teratosphaeriaceae sp. CCFEE 6253]|nr:hypothetical protein LTR53_009591 [Teratosphaeriaceae sp. CCFEE 6253]
MTEHGSRAARLHRDEHIMRAEGSKLREQWLGYGQKMLAERRPWNLPPPPGGHLTEALQASALLHAVPRRPQRKHDLSYINTAKREGWKKHEIAANRHHADTLEGQDRATDQTLERLLASFIRHKGHGPEVGRAESDALSRLDHSEASFLAQKGHGTTDLERWAHIMSTPDSLVAAEALVALVDSDGMKLVPTFLLTYILRRPYIKAHALLLLRDAASEMLGRRKRLLEGLLGADTVFIIFMRLLRHAREVAPGLMRSITELLLTFLPKIGSDDIEQLSRLTFMLNKAMHLVSLSTAVSPMKDTPHQETAIVGILRFMTEHQPQLQITREGYQAVIRIQLSQRKTSSEQQWAELKALSWPPWKQDRTAMDAGITAANHGITTAAATLRRMYEAGYSPTEWEKTASLLAGWDVDGTPTVQMRALLGSGSGRFRSSNPVWAARITATRTAQEAWAAYLAFDDAQASASEEVHLAILQKLHGEEARRRASDGKSAESAISSPRARLLPGDAKEVQALPPSTHLYTYTRTHVPTVEGFVRQLQGQGIHLRGHALALAVANASRLRLGLWYLQIAAAHYPGITGLLSPNPNVGTEEVSDELFSAYIRLLCRYSNVPLDQVHRSHGRAAYEPGRSPLLDGEKLNPHHPIVHALELLLARGTTARPPWNAVLQALSRDATLDSMRFLHVAEARPRRASEEAIEHARGALLASHLVRQTLHTLSELHVDLDSHGFYCRCLAAENATIACWTLLRLDVGPDAGVPERRLTEDVALMQQARNLLRGGRYINSLKAMFRHLVGGNDHAANPPLSPMDKGAPQSAAASPGLLHAPSAGLLHAYVRVLGWKGDHEGLLALVKWMRVHSEELRAQRSADRNSRDLVRRTLVAVRVFLERSWLRGSPELVHGGEGQGLAAAKVTASDVGCSGVGDGVKKKQAGDFRVKYLRELEAGASVELLGEAVELVNGMEEWEGWPTDEQVEGYCQHERFERIRSLGTP